MKVQAPLPASVSNSIWVQQASFSHTLCATPPFSWWEGHCLKKPKSSDVAEFLLSLMEYGSPASTIGQENDEKDFFFDQIQTPVTLFSGKLWSILVVRLAYSADLRSRLCHVSSAPSVAYSTRCSRVVTNLHTNPTRRCLTPVIWREPVYHRR